MMRNVVLVVNLHSNGPDLECSQSVGAAGAAETLALELRAQHLSASIQMKIIYSLIKVVCDDTWAR